MAHLRVVSSDGTSEAFPLRGERVLVGRAHDCDLVLPDVLLSRRHAELVRDERGWLARDLGSLNGTRVNGEALRGERRLHDGDTLVLSEWRLQFVAQDAHGSSPSYGQIERLRDITELATRFARDGSPIARQSRILAVLTRAADSLVATPSADSLLEAMIDHVLEAVPAQSAAVALFDEEAGGEPFVAAARALFGPTPSRLEPGLTERLRLTQAPFVAHGSERVSLCVPLWFAGPPPEAERVAGCVALEARPGRAAFDDEHVRLATAIANLAASRLQSFRLREENAEKRRLEEDVSGAARIQASLLPDETPALPGWEIAGSTRLCSAVGADYYDFATDDGRLLLALGDVAGKGLAAALLMATLRVAVRALWREDQPLAQSVARVNDNLRQTFPANRFATLFLGRLDTRTGDLAYVNAGHSWPLVVRRGGAHQPLETGGVVLGVFPDARWAEGQCRLEPGDALVLCSDGVFEAARAVASDLGPEDLVAAVRRAAPDSAAQALAALQSAADAPLRGARRADDHTFVVVRRQPVPGRE
jgi:serine phosphatase RsbU (regulator of sigma subunit)